MFSKSSLYISVLALLAAILYRHYGGNTDKLSDVLDALLLVEQQHSFTPKTKVAIGYGACHDLFVDGKDLLKYDPNIKEPRHHDHIRTIEELLESYSYFFKYGAAAERYVANETLFEELVSMAQKLPNSHFVVGGNAPVMASRFAKEGCEVLLAAKMTKELQASLDSDITVVGGDVAKDDVHLIMEYKTGEKWGPYTAPRANRFIIHNDNNNPTMSSVEVFGSHLESYDPKLLVVGGLQMMDNYPFTPGYRYERISKIRDQMASQKPSTRVHFEMASFAEEGLLVDLLELVVPYADSLGMNEQELPNLQSVLMFGNISIVSDSNPRVATVLDQMREIYAILAKTEETSGKRSLTRLHVHTLAYQIVMAKKESPWKNSQAAVAKASLTAHRHICGTTEINVKKAMLIMDDSFATSRKNGSRRIPFENDRPVSCWEETVEGTDIEICIAPVLVCTLARQTAGGGDNISSAGLVLQI